MNKTFTKKFQSNTIVNISSLNLHVANNSVCLLCLGKIKNSGIKADFNLFNLNIEKEGHFDKLKNDENGQVENSFESPIIKVDLYLKELILLYFYFWRQGIYLFDNELSLRKYLFTNFLILKERSEGHCKINWQTMVKEFSNLRSEARREEYDVKNIFKRLVTKFQISENYDICAELAQYNKEISLPNN